MTAMPASHLRARVMLAVLSACGFAALAWSSFVSPLPLLVYNASDSVPIGWYRVTPATATPAVFRVGSIVLTSLPADAAALAAQRGYLPLRVPLLKIIGAVSPQHVCVLGGIVTIDDAPVAAVRAVDGRGRPLPSWLQCRALKEGELFLLSTANPASFDSRYFGPVSAAAVIGVAQPIRLERRP